MTRSDPRPATHDPRAAHGATPPLPSACRLFPIPSRRGSARRGFTLIETALAMLAIGLGLLALFGLGRLGLQNAKESENDTRCDLLADAVFETLREVNTRFVANASTNLVSTSWPQQWRSAVESASRIPFPHLANMSASEALYLRINTGKIEPAYDESALLLTDWNPRYELVLSDGAASEIAGDVSLLNVVLAIYPDGDTLSSDPRLYYTTLSNPGGVP